VIVTLLVADTQALVAVVQVAEVVMLYMQLIAAAREDLVAEDS
jgi:hypothetical protein